MATRVVPLGQRWQPGQSGNPSGRRLGLAALVRRSTRNGRELVDYLLDVVRDDNAKARDRIEAVKLLFERGWGRTPTVLDAFLAREIATTQTEADRIPLEALRAVLGASTGEDGSSERRVYDD